MIDVDAFLEARLTPALVKDYWRKHHPALVQEGERTGKLDEWVAFAVVSTREAIQNYLAQKGGQASEADLLAAWELFREEWAYLPPEDRKD